MTCESDFKLADSGAKKRAVFMILPDEKTTYYSLASLFVSQQYELLVNAADDRGGKLEKRVNFILDEFGNFTEIPSFANKLTVGAGRGIRFNLFVQSLAQIEEKYGRENSATIKGNCAIWIYLCADDNGTLDEISKRLGNYTIASHSKSSSYGKHSSGSSSTSINLTGRALLTQDEVRMIDRPYSLITSRNNPAIFIAPDLSEYMFNELFGLGDEEHNIGIRAERENSRPERSKDQCDIKLWCIWNRFNSSANYYHEQKAGYYPAELE
jgi:type IV secretion system protein VirD4